MSTWLDEYKRLGCLDSCNYNMELRHSANERIILTCDPENIKAVLTTQFGEFGKGKKLHERWEAFLGVGIFTTDGQQWHESRQLIRPMFQRERVSDLGVLEEHVRKLIDLLGPGDGRVVDVSTLFPRFALDAACHFLLATA